MKKGNLVHVYWQDAEVTGEWTAEKDLVESDHSSTWCETVGYVVQNATVKSPLYIVASTRSKNDEGKWEYNAITKIPKSWVKEIKEL